MELNKHADERGVLRVIDDRQLPFRVRRVFWISDVPAGATRGHHTHRDSEQFIICLQGGFGVTLDDKYYRLFPDSPGLYAPTYTRIVLDGFTPDALCLVLASDYYNSGEVISDQHKS
jgi:dTDP-4-dehydrorhamnose 3,5-epimerase-like enzyme